MEEDFFLERAKMGMLVVEDDVASPSPSILHGHTILRESEHGANDVADGTRRFFHFGGEEEGGSGYDLTDLGEKRR